MATVLLGIVTAVTAIFVAAVGYFQWRTVQQKAVLELFQERYAIYKVVRDAVHQMTASSPGFDLEKETTFLASFERAYFFFGDDVVEYLNRLWNNIQDVVNADDELGGQQDPETRKEIVERRRKALDRIMQFHKEGRPVFGKYMRFAQPVPTLIRWRSGQS